MCTLLFQMLIILRVCNGNEMKRDVNESKHAFTWKLKPPKMLNRTFQYVRLEVTLFRFWSFSKCSFFSFPQLLALLRS